MRFEKGAVGATIGRPLTYRSNAFSGIVSCKANGHGRAMLAPTRVFRQSGANMVRPGHMAAVIMFPGRCKHRPLHIGADFLSTRGTQRIAAKFLAYRRKPCYNTKAACFNRRQGAAHNGRRLATPPKGGETMRFTFTFYIGRKTFTLSLVVKSNNRHPGR